MRKRNWRPVIVTAGVVVALLLLYWLRMALLPFVFSLAFSYVLIPVVTWLEHRFPKWETGKRVSAIIVVYVIIGATAGALAFYMVNSVFHSVSGVLSDLPKFYKDAALQLQHSLNFLGNILPPELLINLNSATENAVLAIADSVQKNIINLSSALASNVATLIGLASVPYILFYLLKDREKLSNGFYSNIPKFEVHARKIVSILGKVLGQYLRVSITLGLIVGTLDLVGLLILRVPLAPVLAVIGGFSEMVIMVGPWIAGIVAVIVALALAPEKAIWVAVLYLGVQLLENNLIVPRVHATYFKMHPVVTIMLLVIGTYIAGFWGLLLAVPLTATTIEIYHYFRSLKTKEKEGEPIVSEHVNSV